MHVLQLILLILLLPQIKGFKRIKVQIDRREGKILTSDNVLEAANEGLTRRETKQILKQLFRKNLQVKFMEMSEKGFTVTLNMKDLVTILSEKPESKKNPKKAILKKKSENKRYTRVL